LQKYDGLPWQLPLVPEVTSKNAPVLAYANEGPANA
jgi:hypothetical protein